MLGERSAEPYDGYAAHLCLHKVRSTFEFGVNEMTHDRFAFDVRRDQRRQIAIGAGQTLVLTQMFGPRDDDECLEIGVGLFEIAIQTPSRRSIPAPDALVLPHRPKECVCVL